MDLEDDVDLTAPCHVQLVLLPFSEASLDDRKELIRAAGAGQVPEVELILQRPQDPNLAHEGDASTPFSTPLLLGSPVATLLPFF